MSENQNTPQNRELANPRPVCFESLGLIVKFGSEQTVDVSEGQCLWALRRFLPAFPVPEIYGWSTEGDYVLLYMEKIRGVTVDKRWDSMTDQEKVGFSEEMKSIIANLRSLRQDPADRFLGKTARSMVLSIKKSFDQCLQGQINRTAYRDRSIPFRKKPAPGPFDSVIAFHDWLSLMVRGGRPYPDPYREKLPDDAEVVFTHADLHPSNIMVDPDSPSKVLAVLDWEQSGWYPDYWEYCKAEFTVKYGSNWHVHMSTFLQEPSVIETFEDYTRSFGYCN